MAKSRRKKRKRRLRRAQPWLLAEYYHRAFYLFEMELARRSYPAESPHALRRSFWRLVPPGEYSPTAARPIVLSYLGHIETELASICSQQSLGYWLHVYRRIAPGPVCGTAEPATVLSVREIVETAVHKYARFRSCSRIGVSNEIAPEKVFKGLYLASQFEAERAFLRQNPQLVLTDFGVDELQAVYELEKLGFEVWKSAATLRILGKGASLIVDADEPYFYDNRSDELDRLVKNYDDRHRDPNASASGTVFSSAMSAIAGNGLIMLPFWNVYGVSAAELSKLFALFKLRLASPEDLRTNFIWAPVNLSSYYEAHLPFAEAFESLHGLPLIWVLTVLGALCERVLYVWNEAPGKILHYWQRAYEGPHKREYILREIAAFLPAGTRALGVTPERGAADVERVFSSLCLTDAKRVSIDIASTGPQFVFLPFNEERFFIDYRSIYRLLYHLFYEVQIPDQNFKGAALEQAVHCGSSCLPTGPLKSLNGELRQVDAAFDLEDTLLIVECKAAARSFGVDRGDGAALQYRERLVERALGEVDEKARWLSRNPVGTNYDVRKFRRILPLAVTPFVEYIPSASPRYWLSDVLPH